MVRDTGKIPRELRSQVDPAGSTFSSLSPCKRRQIPELESGLDGRPAGLQPLWIGKLTMGVARARMRITALLALLAFALALPVRSLGFQPGQEVQDFFLKDTAGKGHALSQYAGKIVVLEFWSFKCPISLAYRDRMAALQEKYQGRGVVFLAIASNRNESPDEVARNAANLKMPYPVLLDTESMVAERFGATHTPSIFILDANRALCYRGAPDNNKTVGEAGRQAFAEEAIDALLSGKPVPHPQTREFGCAIRRTSY